eukprot:9233171-Pyramimonas_sp.AAC.1
MQEEGQLPLVALGGSPDPEPKKRKPGRPPGSRNKVPKVLKDLAAKAKAKAAPAAARAPGPQRGADGRYVAQLPAAGPPLAVALPSCQALAQIELALARVSWGMKA